MAKLRKGVSYRSWKRPYTRKSKYRKKNFVRASPHNLIVRYDMGDLQKKFEYKLEIKSKSALQIRHNALEAARKSGNRVLEKKTGKVGFMLKLRVYPHHILRENPLASGAGADRMSTGMAHPFGKPIGLAAQIHKNQTIFDIHVDKNNLPAAKEAAKRIQSKIPCPCQFVITKSE